MYLWLSSTKDKISTRCKPFTFEEIDLYFRMPRKKYCEREASNPSKSYIFKTTSCLIKGTPNLVDLWCSRLYVSKPLQPSWIYWRYWYWSWTNGNLLKLVLLIILVFRPEPTRWYNGNQTNKLTTSWESTVLSIVFRLQPPYYFLDLQFNGFVN